MPQRTVLIVANEPAPEKEAEYNLWYNETHIPLMFGFKGMRKATRYRRSGENSECSKYLAVYEFDSPQDLAAFTQSPEFQAAIKDFDEKWKDGGFERKWGSGYEMIQTWQK